MSIPPNIVPDYLSVAFCRQAGNRFRRLWPGFILLIAGLLFFSDSAKAGQPDRNVELRLWHTWRAEKLEILEAIIEDFNCRSESTKISAEPIGPLGGSVAERLLLRPDAYGKPELALVERETIPMLADAGIILPLDKLGRPSATSSEMLQEENLLDAALKFVSYDGKPYGFPVRLNPYVLIYNSEDLAAAGISGPPPDWKTFIKQAKLLSGDTSADDRQWGLSVRSMEPLFKILCLQKGIDFFGAPEEGSGAETIRETLGFIEDLRKSHALLPPQYKFWNPNFMDVSGGRVPFQIDNVSMLAYLLEKTPVPLSVAMVPSDVQPARTSLASGYVFVVLTSTVHVEEAKEFLKFFYSPEQYSRFADKLLFVYPFRNSDSIQRRVSSHKQIYSKLIQASENADVYPLTYNSGTVSPRVARIVDKVDAGLISIGEAEKQIQEAMQIEDKRASPSRKEPIRILWAESTRRLSTGETSSLRRAPVKIVSARNEHEVFQLVLSAESSVDDLSLKIAPLVSKNGAQQEVGMTAYLETDTLISMPLVAGETGLYPNVLEPRGKFDIPARSSVRIWIDVYTANEIPAGEYFSQIAIRCRESDVASVPIRFRVLPFRIPAIPTQPSTIGLNYDLISQHYGLDKEGAGYRKLMDSFYWFLVDHRISPYQPPVSIDSEEINSYMGDERVSSCRFPIHPNSPSFKKAAAIAKENGWLDKLFVYFIDEPTYHQYKTIIDAGRYIDSMAVSPKFLVTCFPDEQLIGTVDIWCIHLRFLPTGIPSGLMDRTAYVDAVNRRLNAGDEVWWYTAGAVAPLPSLHIEDDPAAFRIIPWLQQLYGIDGFLHWEAANWIQSSDNPFIEFFGNGEGVLVYPGDMRPNPSIRLELLREGLEDMEYLMLLRRKYESIQKKLGAEQSGDMGSIRVGEICRRLISDNALRANAADGLFLLPHFLREPGLIESVREELADEMILLEERPYALILTEPEEKQYTDSSDARIFGVVEQGCAVEVNGRNLTVDEAGNFSARFPVSSGSNIFSILLKKGEYTKRICREIIIF